MTTERSNLVHIAMGICVTALGILLLLQQLGLFQLVQILRLWPVALIVMGGAIAWQASRGGPAIPGASVGAVIWILVLGLVFSYTYERRMTATIPDGDGHVNVFSIMSGDRRQPLTGTFRSGQITAVMGGASLDLRQVTLAPGETAELDVFMVFGGASIRVPAGWRVELEASVVAGGVKDERRRPATEKPGEKPGEKSGEKSAEPDAGQEPVAVGGPPSNPASESPLPAPRLIVRGVVIMAGVTVKS